MFGGLSEKWAWSVGTGWWNGWGKKKFIASDCIADKFSLHSTGRGHSLAAMVLEIMTRQLAGAKMNPTP